jgi:hypothetical protein
MSFLREVWDLAGAGWSVEECVHSTLEGLKLVAFGGRGIGAADAFASLMREFLGLQAGWRVKLHFDAQPGLWAAPLAVDSFVLLI